LVALHVGMAVLAFTIHFLLLSTDRYNWMDQPMGQPASASAAVELLDPPALS
jgi:light-harvesting complex 1 alpha chain